MIGSCQCGNVSYTLFEKPKMVIACHCTECQKLSTSPFSVTAIVPSSAIEFKGEMKEWGRNSDSGNINVGKFCPNCGNRIYQVNPNDLNSIKLKLKPVNLSDDSLFEPTVHVWTSEKL
ncbi:GFA family protein, partial [Psychromonas sp.]|nr:GFA family protein [Psychromonas sp.]